MQTTLLGSDAAGPLRDCWMKDSIATLYPYLLCLKGNRRAVEQGRACKWMRGPGNTSNDSDRGYTFFVFKGIVIIIQVMPA